MSTLLIISHTPSPHTVAMSQALLQGAMEHAEAGLEVVRKSPFEVSPDDVLAVRGLIIGTTENFGYMAGATKDFFDRCYYGMLDKTTSLPYAVYIRAGLDGTGTSRAISNICGGLKWKPVQAPLVLQGEFKPQFERDCEELGAIMAAGLSAGIF